MEKITRNAATKKAGLWICAIVFTMIFLCAGKTDKVFAASAAGSSDKNAKVLTLNDSVNGNTSAGETVWFSYTPQRNRIFYLSGHVDKLVRVVLYENKEQVQSIQGYENNVWNSAWNPIKDESISNFGIYHSLKAGKTYYYEFVFKNNEKGKYNLHLMEMAGEGDPCGANLTWNVDKGGMLTISGAGEMFDYAWCEQGTGHFCPRIPPWYGQNITAIKLENGITSIGDYAFQYCKSVTSVQIPTGVKTIGGNSFVNCAALAYVSLPDTITEIGLCAFNDCKCLKKITIPASVKKIEYAAVGCEFAGKLEGSIPVKDFVISGYSGSAAETYAKEYKIKFIALDKPQVPTPTPAPEVKLGTPKLGKVVSAGYNSVKLSWNSVKGADGYRIYVKSGDNWKALTDVKGNVTSYTHKGLTCGKNYTYTVRAYKDTKPKKTYSSYSKTGITGKPMLSTPTIKSIKANKTSIKMTWKPISGAAGYVVYRKTGSESWNRIATIKGGTISGYTDKNVENGKKYTYTVKAYRTVNKKTVYSNYNKTGKTVKK